ncbi:hypothetical protein [Shimia haliotis]|uniref:Glycerophosphoryl diester phosphodiesterase membrane domain-containing protein n=1 Tax=Shimia haliotis TaxID=1280847 RepID=A0A1I4EII1_9RHOB|nr:hypothetical protein [Shimia haliotis]SFL05568.1 hypothetical protein SAMN04488036_104316 [Shimia haliotis]
MKGWTIFAHSVGLAARNWKEALKIFLVPVALCVGLFVVVGGSIGLTSGEPTGSMALLFLMFPLMFIVIFWSVVSWHRFVLLEEYPTGWLPTFRFDRILSYLGHALLLGLVAFVLMIPVVALMALFASMGAEVLAVIVAVPAYIALVIVMYRLVPILPAAAIGKPLKLMESFNATKGAAGAIIVLLLVVFGVNLGVQLVVMALTALFAPLGILFSLAASLFLSIVNISVLTTFYGHYIEGRPLD